MILFHESSPSQSRAIHDLLEALGSPQSLIIAIVKSIIVSGHTSCLKYMQTGTEVVRTMGL